MAKPQLTEDDDALLAELGVDVETKKAASRTPREERIIAGFEEIERFVTQHGRLPGHGEDKDIFERLYAVRLDKMRGSAECRTALEGLDVKGLLGGGPVLSDNLPDDIDDEALLSQLGMGQESESDITKLTHVKTRAERKAAEDVAQRTQCHDFEKFKSLLVKVQEDLKSGARQSRRFKEDASIKQGEFFILGGQLTYVSEVGEEIRAPNGDLDARLRVIYDNGTESNILKRSLQRALHKDETGRRVTEPSAGPLFSDEQEEEDIESGAIYVLRSKSDDEYVRKNRDVLHKIGVTGGEIKKRIANAKNDPTFLLADVEIIATYKLANINRIKLEKIIHRFFASAKLDIQITDRFGHPVTAREWFLVPLFAIDQMVEKMKEGRLEDNYYDPKSAQILPYSNKKQGKS